MDGYSKVKDNTNIMLHKFSSNKYLAGTQEFLESNSIVATFAFIILVLILFFVLLRLGSSIMTWVFSPTESPVLINLLDGFCFSAPPPVFLLQSFFAPLVCYMSKHY